MDDETDKPIYEPRPVGREWSRSKTSGKKFRQRERWLAILDMRKEGHTLADIGKAFNISSPRVHEILSRELARLNGRMAETVGEVRRLESERLDKMLTKAFKFTEGDDPMVVLKALDSVVKIMDRRARLMGLDVPVMRTVRTIEFTPAELLAEARRSGLTLSPGVQTLLETQEREQKTLTFGGGNDGQRGPVDRGVEVDEPGPSPPGRERETDTGP